MSPFVTPAELEEITGLTQHAAQIRWLNNPERAWKFEISATGRPIVLRAEMERHLLGGREKRVRRLNLSAIAASA